MTSTESGLSVPDWPTTYGHNMFTFPLSKWVGGIRFEHAHRLIASTVGLLTVVLAVWLARREPRRWVRRLGYARARRGRRAGRARRADGALSPADRHLGRARVPRADLLLPDGRDRRRDVAPLDGRAPGSLRAAFAANPVARTAAATAASSSSSSSSAPSCATRRPASRSRTFRWPSAASCRR